MKKLHMFASRIAKSHYSAQWMAGIRNACTKIVAQYSCIVAVLLSTMNDRDKKNVHQVCGSIDFAVLLSTMNNRD